jgi:DNA-binding MarR family transcriptional regulator
VTLKEWSERRRAVQDVLSELTVWTPREREGAFRSWLRRSFSLVHLHVLTLLETSGPMSIGALAESLDVSVAAVTGIVDRMEERRLVERRHKEDDRRVVLVHPTRRGSRLFEALGRQRRAALAPILERMTDEEIAATLTGLRAMRRVRAEILRPGAPDLDGEPE